MTEERVRYFHLLDSRIVKPSVLRIENDGITDEEFLDNGNGEGLDNGLSIELKVEIIHFLRFPSFPVASF